MLQYTNETDKLIPALFNARKDMSSGARKNTKNAHLKSSYANLESFLAAIRPALEAQNLMLIQSWVESASEGNRGNCIYLTTQIMHVSGQSLTVTSPFPLGTKIDAHAVGSAITYARRYSIAALFGIAQSDDDGNATRLSSTEIVKMIKEAETVEKLEKMHNRAKLPDFFGNSPSEMRVITGAYNDRKRELSKVGETFRPAEAAAKNSQPEPEQQDEPAQQPGEFENF